ncbi:DUF4287 domain-containing protein [Cryobacterium arcticum]|uniref:DUF5655 domain-containing protein n=1 Tax=Cryobacterium arcticum TaxID=670052 RepID=A0A1B1BEL3_9MICO|nr:DUF4287 domain-containing protein [Cryobacterium arcticum]ANP71010.1 hypothetical protein PA27867_0031 [Cryobacterium arcticum]
MTSQAYLDTIKAKTGLGPDDFRAAAAAKGLLGPDVKTARIVAWLKEDYGLGTGHAMALVSALGQVPGQRLPVEEKINAQFSGAKAHWRATYDALLAHARQIGEVNLAPTNSYISLLRGTKKFAIVQVTAGRLDLGLKLPGVNGADALEASGSWNSMVTHRVRLADPAELTDDVLAWLRRAYDAA